MWKSREALLAQRGIRYQLLLGVAMAVAFLALYGWTHHSDTLKQLNLIGAHLTSSELRSWNFGHLGQRLSSDLWTKVVVRRMFTSVATLPIMALLAGGLATCTKVPKEFLLACLFLAFAPLLLFSNLHIVHNYYQSSNQIYLLMALSASVASIYSHARHRLILKLLVVAAFAIILIGGYASFCSEYWPSTRTSTSSKIAIGAIIQKSTPPNSAILVFGDDWSSAFAFHSIRRSFAMPDWGNLHLTVEGILQDSKHILAGHPLGAVVSAQPIRDIVLRPICGQERYHAIEGWHLYVCEP